MTDTNTTGPSEAIQRYTARVGYSDYRTNFWVEMDAHGQGGWVKHSDHLAALARAREEARREAFEQAGWACLALSEGGDLAATCARRMAELARKEQP